jgi:hypothetical protein
MSHDCHIRPAVTRRDVLVRAAHGFGSVAWRRCSIRRLCRGSRQPAGGQTAALSRQGQVGHLPLHGRGPSQVDTFDPKPALEKYNGQPLPASYGTIVSQFTKGDTPLLRSPGRSANTDSAGATYRPFPAHRQRVDDLCFVRSFYTDSTVHAPAMYQVNTAAS